METVFLLNNETVNAPKEPIFLIDFLRSHRHITGTKAACREGDCGSCQVLIQSCHDNGLRTVQAQTSCLLTTADILQRHIITIEAIPKDSPLIVILAESGASQCGFCSPGLVMAVLNWLINGITLDESEGLEFINGNLCRCTGYMGQRRAISSLADIYQKKLASLGLEERCELLKAESILPEWFSNSLSISTPANYQPLETCTSNTQSSRMAGGTDLYLESSSAPITLEKIPVGTDPNSIKLEPDTLLLNARHPVEWVARSLKQRSLFPAFRRWNHLFASLPIRSQATLGGNIAHASPIADGICLMMTLDATLITNQRDISIHDFFLGMKKTVLQDAEILEWIAIPNRILNHFIHYEKVCRRQTTDIAVVNCSSAWRLNKDLIVEVNITIGGATEIPIRLTDVENRLKGKSCLTSTAEIKTIVAPLIEKAISPISDLRGSAVYRRILAIQLVQSQWLAAQSHYQEGLLDD